MFRKQLTPLFMFLSLSSCTNGVTPAARPVTPKTITTPTTIAAPETQKTVKESGAILTKEEATQQVALAQKGLDTLELNSVTTLDVEVASILATFKGKRIELKGLASLDASVATTIAAFEGDFIDLSGLTSIDANTATALATFQGDTLYLGGVKEPSEEMKTALSSFQGSLHVSWK